MKDTKQAREKVAVELAKLRFKSVKNYRIFESIVTTIIWGLVLGVCLWLFISKKYSLSEIKTFVILFGLLVIIIQFFLSRQGMVLRRKNLQMLKEARLNLHQIFFENLSNPFPELDFKFTGIGLSPVYQNNCLIFKLNEEVITWNIMEENEDRPLWEKEKLSWRGKGYTLKYSLNSTTRKLNGISQISMVKLNDSFVHFFDHQDDLTKARLFKSESVEFNQQFLVEGLNKIDTYKIFTPKVIDDYLQLNSNHFFTDEVVLLKNGEALVNLNKRKWKKTSWVSDPLDFSRTRWNKKNTVNDILDKIELDFQRYLAAQKLLIPLDLY